MIVPAEKVAVRPPFDAVLKVVSPNVHDASIVPVTFKKSLAKPKERRVWKTVVFQDNGFLDVLKDPGDTTGNPTAASQVGGRVIPVHFARPVNVLNNRPR
jgi:hypothetical protein